MTALYQRRKIFINGHDISNVVVSTRADRESGDPYWRITLDIIGQVSSTPHRVDITAPTPLQQSPTEAEVLSEGEPS